MRLRVSGRMETVGSPFASLTVSLMPAAACVLMSSSFLRRTLLTEEVPREPDAVELARSRLRVTAPVPQRDQVVAGQECVELELGQLVARRCVLLDVRVRHVLEDDCPTPEDAVRGEEVRAVVPSKADAVVAHAVPRRRHRLELEVADPDPRAARELLVALRRLPLVVGRVEPERLRPVGPHPV